MQIEVIGGHWEQFKALGRRHHALRMSVQSYWTFFNFEHKADAKAFLADANAKGFEDCFGVNTERPFVKYEVALRKK